MEKPLLNIAPNTPEYTAVLGAMDDILDSEKFVASPQMSAFLRYVVKQTLSGRHDQIKAYSVAVDALGKPVSFDPQNDPLVRVLAGRLRAALVNFYDASDSQPIRIEMKRGSYVPRFIQLMPIAIKQDTDSSEHQSKNQPLAITGKTTDLHPDKPFIDVERLLPFLRFPWIGIALLLLIMLIVPTIAHQLTAHLGKSEVAQNTTLTNQSSMAIISRARPEKISIFVSASPNLSAFEKQLNSLVSSVLAESNDVHAYRTFEQHSRLQHWPEDYFLELEVLALNEETWVGIQLIQVLTGRVVDSERLHLKKQATTTLTKDDIATISTLVQSLYAANSDLMMAYQQIEHL